MFGASAAALGEDGDGDGGGGAFAGASRRVRRLAARGLIRLEPLRHGIMITPRETWPRFDGGFELACLGPGKDGKNVFSIRHSPAYEVCVGRWRRRSRGSERGQKRTRF